MDYNNIYRLKTLAGQIHNFWKVKISQLKKFEFWRPSNHILEFRIIQISRICLVRVFNKYKFLIYMHFKFIVDFWVKLIMDSISYNRFQISDFLDPILRHIFCRRAYTSLVLLPNYSVAILRNKISNILKCIISF
jgi:hypothetical protein